jgi:DNA-binding MarR family transcriptional regulator
MNIQASYNEQEKLNLKLLIALARGVQSMRKQELITIREGNLTLAQFGVLEYVYHRGDARIKDIIQRMLATGGNMTVVVDNLEKMGLIFRYPDPNDKRARLIALTDRGKTLMETVFPRHVKHMSEVFSVFDDEEKRQLIYLMRKLTTKDRQ